MTNQASLQSPEIFELWNIISLTLPGVIEPGSGKNRHTVIEDSPIHGCAYTAIHFEKDKLFPACCCGDKRTCRMMLQDLKIKII